MAEEEIHTNDITGGQDKKAAFPRDWLDSTIGIPVFPDVMAGDRGANTMRTPAVFGLVDPPESRFILEHQPHFSTGSNLIVDFFLQFLPVFVNFFEDAMSSSLAFFGCWLRGITLRHPCRSKTR